MMGRSIVSTIIFLYAFSAFAEGGYTNHAGNVVPVQAKQDGPYEFKPLVVDGKEVPAMGLPASGFISV